MTEGTHCAICGEILVAQEIVPLAPHTEIIDPGTLASCTETGVSQGTHCSVCGQVVVPQQIVPAHEHKAVTEPAIPATCTTSGYTEGAHCAICGEVLTERQSVPALAHTEAVDPAVPATCTLSGLTEGSHCAVCGRVLQAQERTPVVPHGNESTVIPPDCEHAGYTEHRCPDCGLTWTDAATPALGHAPQRFVSEEDGGHIWVCERGCGTSIQTECTDWPLLTHPDVLSLCPACLGMSDEELMEFASTSVCPVCGRFGDTRFNVENDVLILPAGDMPERGALLVRGMEDPMPGVAYALTVAWVADGELLPLPEGLRVLLSVPITAGTLRRVDSPTNWVDVSCLLGDGVLSFVPEENGLYLLVEECCIDPKIALQ